MLNTYYEFYNSYLSVNVDIMKLRYGKTVEENSIVYLPEKYFFDSSVLY